MDSVNTEQDMQKLSQIENNLYKQLEHGSATGTLSVEQKELIIDQLNNLNAMRVQLYDNMNDNQHFYVNNLQSVTDTVSAQNNALNIVSEEIKSAENKLEELEQAKNNKYRLVEINDYYTQQYQNNISILKYAIFYLVLVIILIYLNKKQIIPGSIYSIGLIVILVIFCINIGAKVYDAYQRSNMYYDEYSFAPPPASYSTSNKTDLPKFSLLEDVCIDQECCPKGFTYTKDANKCVPSTKKVTDASGNKSAASKSTPLTYDGMSF